MHFELTLRSDKTYEKHYSYGLIFIPGPVWIKENSKLINMSQNPRLELGSIKITEHEAISNLFQDNLEAIINIRNIEAWTDEDLNTLEQDLNNHGFSVTII